MSLPGPMTGSAVWGDPGDETSDYRYYLSRKWPNHGDGRTCLFVMLNPSTATGEAFDPTVRRCAGYATDWGFSELIVGNIFAYRATDPRDMKSAENPVEEPGEKGRNDFWLSNLSRKADLTVCAWGNHGQYMSRGQRVRELVDNPHALTITGAGEPGHPLYLSKDLEPFAI